jgi:TP901 family phage tail tape measure protein
MAGIGDLKVLIGANIDPLLKNLKKAEANIQMTARNMQAVGDSMLKLTAPILGVAAVSFKMAADFDDGMRKVQAVSGATGEELEKLRDLALEMGKSTRFGATESAAAMNYMGQAGWNTQQIMTGLPGVLALAAASGEDLAMVSDIVTDGLTGFKLAAEDSGRFADVLAKAAAASNTNVAMMGETFKYVSPVAGALGFSIEDTAVAIGLMANAGIKGSQAGTALRAMISRMVKPVGESAKAMKELGLSVTDADGKMKPMNQLVTELREKFAQLTPAQQAQMAASIAGQEAMSGMLALVTASDADFAKLTEQINNSAGAAQDMADTMEGGAGGGLRKMQKALQNAAITLGDAFAPMVEKVVALVTRLANWFSDLSDETKETFLQVTLLVAGLGAVFKVTGLLISGVGSMVSTFKSLYTVFNIVKVAAASVNAVLLANPVGLVVAAIAALIAIITAAIYKYEKWGAAVLLLMGPLGMVVNIIQSFRRHWDSVVSAFKTDGILAGLKRIGLVLLDAVLMPMQQLLELASKIPMVGDLAGKGAAKIEQLRRNLNLVTVTPEQLEKPAKQAAEVVVKAFEPAAIAAQIEDNASKSMVTGITKAAEKAKKQLVEPLQGIGSSIFSNMFGGNMDFSQGIPEKKQPGQVSSLTGMDGQTALIQGMDGAMQSLVGTMQRMGQVSQESGTMMAESVDSMMERLGAMADNGSLVAQIVESVGSTIMASAEQGATGMKDLASAALDAGAKVVRSFIMQGVASAVSKALSSIPFPLNIAAGAMAGAAAGVLFNGLLNKIRAPKLAKGGLAYGPTMAMVGDNPGASVDPEVISPLSKLRDMINSNVTVNLAGEFRMSGRDLWLVVDKENQIQKRLKGV